MTTPGLTLIMIVRDERDPLAELLPLVVPIVDDVVVVDTGSTDGTPQLARELGARVLEQEWADDFSRPRNRALEEVRTSHVLWLDADDRVTAEDLTRIRAEALARGDVGLRLRVISVAADPLDTTHSFQLRVFPTRPEHRFRGRVHEQIQPALEATGTGVEELDVPIRHLGYAREEDVQQKALRNLRLCRMEATAGRDDPTMQFHHLQAAVRAGVLDEAVRVARRCLDAATSDTPRELLWNTARMLGNAECRRGQHRAAQQAYERALQLEPEDALTHYALAELLHETGALDAATRCYRRAARCPARTSSVPVAQRRLRQAIHVRLAEVLEKQGKHPEAVAEYRTLLDEDPDDLVALARLGRALLAAGEVGEARQVVQRWHAARELASAAP